MDFDPLAWKQAIDTGRAALELVRGVFGAVKDAKEVATDPAKAAAAEEVEKVIARADHQFCLADAQAAKALGYHLCQCTFPPQIMLSIGRHPRGDERFQCPRCNSNEPPDKYFREMEAFDRHNRGGGDSRVGY